jgi:hypothetical protein
MILHFITQLKQHSVFYPKREEYHLGKISDPEFRRSHIVRIKKLSNNISLQNEPARYFGYKNQKTNKVYPLEIYDVDETVTPSEKYMPVELWGLWGIAQEFGGSSRVQTMIIHSLSRSGLKTRNGQKGEESNHMTQDGPLLNSVR